MSADAPASLPEPYEVTPYVVDGGGGSLAGTLQMISILSSIGILVGMAVSFISQWLYVILIFPLVMGLVVGFFGAKTIERYHIRRPILCGSAGFAAGCFCFLAMHYSDYRRFEGRLSEVPEEVRQIARNLDKLSAEGDRIPKDVRAIMAELRSAPDALRALRVANFLDFMHLQAEQGVTIAGQGARNGMNLGYVGSMIYWVAEAVFLACVAFGSMKAAAAKPYCCECNSWKTPSPLIVTTVLPSLIFRYVRAGDLSTIEQLLTDRAPVTNASEIFSKVMTHLCPHCESASPFEVSVVQATKDDNGAVTETNLGLITYPGEALVPLLAVVNRINSPIQPMTDQE